MAPAPDKLDDIADLRVQLVDDRSVSGIGVRAVLTSLLTICLLFERKKAPIFRPRPFVKSLTL